MVTAHQCAEATCEVGMRANRLSAFPSSSKPPQAPSSSLRHGGTRLKPVRPATATRFAYALRPTYHGIIS